MRKSFMFTLFIVCSMIVSSCSTKPFIVQKPKFDSHAQYQGRSLASVGYTTLTPPTRRIVVLKKGSAAPAVKARGVGKKYGASVGHVYKHAIRGFSMSLPDAAVAALLKDADIDYIANDKPKKISAQEVPNGIRRILADTNQTAKIGTGNIVDIDVAVIDTGVDINHPDINVHAGANFSKGKSYDDGNGHGTHVAGTIGALDNGIGVVGVAPGARIWAVRVLDNRGSGWTSDIVAGIDYVTANADKIEVANMSLGGPGTDDGNCGNTNNDPEHQAICASVAAGVVYVVAAGNDSEDSKNSTPASYDEVITVSALADSDGLPGGSGVATSYGADDSLASFSNFGADVDIAAPGVDINSTWLDGGYNSISGTSMASPHVAGAAALYMAKFAADNSGSRPSVGDVKTALLSASFPQTSSDGFSGDNDGYAEPLLNAGALDPGVVAPAVKVALSTDKSKYRTDLGDTTVVVTASVTDENGAEISGLTGSAFASTLNGSSSSVNYVEQSAGQYQASYFLSADGDYTLSTTVTDGRSLSGTASASYAVRSSEDPSMFISDISYAGSGGKSNDRNLLVSLTVSDTNNTAVEGATVEISLYRDGSFVGSGSAQTGLSGSVTFNLRNASSGCYTTDVSAVSKTGMIYDSNLNAADPGFCKP
ncbi:MAG: peptidase S8/S53 subtilisin kexin sedolisin [Deltaproteobacteria bacterium]|nr:MAG: peptidase S8/S53 subtilisin kexin sedolisin [Deltaproteobacteria bacterium]